MHHPPSPARTDRATLEAFQRDNLAALIRTITPDNGFYTPRLAAAGIGVDCSLEDFCAKMPLTTKEELMADQEAHPPYGLVHTFPPDRYVRCHQTSGTTGKPLRWLDTAESWQWMVDCWKEVFIAADIGAGDRVMFTFSFGPFIGFWLAWDAAQQLGCLCIPGGGMNSAQRIQLMTSNAANVLCCTPTYAVRLAEVAQTEGIDLTRTAVKKIIAAGEPGSSVPVVRERIISMWNGAELYDHHGMTEIGCVTYQCPQRPGVLHVIEEAFITEVIDPVTLAPVGPGEKGELILTNLGRHGSPLLRYRTGDLVLPEPPGVCECGSANMALVGGILDRADDMVVVRGVNVYPSAVNEVLRAHPGLAEYRVEIDRSSAMTEMRILVEPAPDSDESPEELAASIGHDLRESLAMRVPIRVVEPGALPRFEMKARRWVVQ
ncbi:MAG: phenylacetate--CoA ligase family protein [Planctomycetota bacterium]